MTIRGSSAIQLVIPVEPDPDLWVLEDDANMPETALHRHATEHLALVLEAWVRRTARNAFVGRNTALRWDRKRPTYGVDPDVYVVEPPPPGADREELDSICTWKPGHRPPFLAVEIVSKTNSTKDYSVSPDKYAAAKVPELWVFDPELAGPSVGGGPFLLQLWRTNARGQFVRTYRGDGPLRSVALGAWAVVTDGGRRLRVADDPEGVHLWPTAEETERALKDTERALKDTERALKDTERAGRLKAEAELAALREQLAGVASPKPRAKRLKKS